MIRAILIVAGAFALDPCNLDLPGYDGGADAAADSGPSQTVGTQCTAIVTELCNQGLSRCALSYSISDCITSDMPACCSSGDTCDQKSTSSKGDVDTCKADIDAMDCNFVVNSTLPPSCQGLLHP